MSAVAAINNRHDSRVLGNLLDGIEGDRQRTIVLSPNNFGQLLLLKGY